MKAVILTLAIVVGALVTLTWGWPLLVAIVALGIFGFIGLAILVLLDVMG